MFTSLIQWKSDLEVWNWFAQILTTDRFVMASKIVLMAKMKIIVQPHPT